MANDLTAEAIQKVLDIAEPSVFMHTDAQGRNAPFAFKQMHEVRAAAPPLVDTAEVFTLDGFADLIRHNVEALQHPVKPDTCLIHIEGERVVSLVARNSDKWGRREVIIKASPVPYSIFPFGQWIDQEEFVIKVASMFAENDDRAYVLQIGSTLTREAMMTSEDDGFSQKATARQGLRTKENITLKPRVSLAPFRTFPELGQPVSEFVFRARSKEGENPLLMLVEADGGRWKIDAIAKIKAHLDLCDLHIPIIA